MLHTSPYPKMKMVGAITDDSTEDMVLERTGAARRVLIEAILLGVMADALLRFAPEGLGWTAWVAALALAAVNVARYSGSGLTREQLSWLAAAVACAGAFAWRDAENLRVANVFATLVAVSLFSMSAAGAPAPSILVARVRDVVGAGVYAARDVIFGTPVLVARDAKLHTHSAFRGGASWTVLRAVLLTVPVALVFTILLSRADPAFEAVFALPTIDTELIFSHVFVAGAFAWWSAGWMSGAMMQVMGRPALPDRLPMRLGSMEVTSVLGTVAVLFVIYVALQLRWLFGGADLVLATSGLTVAEYARRGFFELVTVAALVLPLILGTRAVIEDEGVLRRHRQLSVVLLGLLAAIVVSAMSRMRLYVELFGLTTDRLYATAFMVWLVLVFGAMALTVLRGRTGPFAAMAVFWGFLTLGTLNVLNPDLVVARVNLGRSAVVRAIDYAYLARLSGDAVPAVVQALRAAEPSVEACKAAESLRTRWAVVTDPAWNLGARRGQSSVTNYLMPAELERLCAGSAAGGTPGA
ncbi:MAG: DUF4153 domain-containing protein [Gemmatimonadota bacterium]